MTTRPLHLALVTLLFCALVLGSGTAAAQGLTRPLPLEVLADYELIRAALARDDGGAIAVPARRIVQRVNESPRAASATRPHLVAAARAAGTMTRTDVADLSALRRAFGHLSRALVALLEAAPELARGVHLFECPMAQGYGQWIQRTSDIQNPYMGSRMLTCGRRIDG